MCDHWLVLVLTDCAEFNSSIIMSKHNKYYLRLVIMVPAVQYSQTRMVVLVYKITEVNVAYARQLE